MTLFIYFFLQSLRLQVMFVKRFEHLSNNNNPGQRYLQKSNSYQKEFVQYMEDMYEVLGTLLLLLV